MGFDPTANFDNRRKAFGAVNKIPDAPKYQPIKPTVAVKAATPAPLATQPALSARDRLSNILNVNPQAMGRVTPGAVGRPVMETARWAEEQYLADNMPWYIETLTTGPVGAFLNTIQKPLALTTSYGKEMIDLFTGGDASWGDFKKQYNDNYTFGRLLHDFDILQDRDSGWQKFGAAALGFVGDVAFDPLSYLGLIGKGVAFGGALTKGAARHGARELVRKSVLTSLKSQGDEVVAAVAKSMKTGDWHALADDIATKAHHGGKDTLKLTTSADGTIAHEWVSRVSRAGVDDTASVTVKFGTDKIADLERFMDIGGRATQFGATSVSGDDLRFAAKMFGDSGLDKHLRFGADDFVDELGKGIRSQVDADAGDIEKAFSGAWFKPGEAEKLSLGFGFKVPGTGPIGRALRISDPVEKIVRRVARTGADAPIGIRFMTSETPLVGNLITGIPQGLRNGIVRQAAMAVGVKKTPQWLRRKGLARLLTGGRLSGRMGDLKNQIRTSTDAVFVHQGKRVIHATGRGKQVGNSAKVTLTRLAEDFMAEVNAVGADYSAVYHAIAGDAGAVAHIGPEGQAIADKGRDLFNALRDEANRMGGRDFLEHVDDYVPRQLTDEAREAIQESFGGIGKFDRRSHMGRNAYTPTGPEMKRKYVSMEEFADDVAARAKADGIGVDEAEKLMRTEGNRSGRFFGEELHRKGTPVEGGADGEVWGSVEKQIMDITERLGGDYALFTDDIELALKGYIKQISGRVGEVYTETMLFKDGIMLNRLAEYVTIPTQEAVLANRGFVKAQESFKRASGDLIEAINRQRNNIGDAAANEQQVKELTEVMDQAEIQMVAANKRQESWYGEMTRHEENYLEWRTKVDDLDSQIDNIRSQIDEAGGDELAVLRLEEQRQGLLDRLSDLRSDGASLRFSYNRLSSGTTQVLYLERAVNKIFKTSETFEAFVRDFSGFKPTDPNGQLDELAASGEKMPEFVVKVGDKWHYVAPNGSRMDLEDTFMRMDGVLQQADEKGVGTWLGVERDLDILAPQPKVKIGERVSHAEEGFYGESFEAIFGGFDTGNAANKIDYMLKRVRLEIEDASRVLSDYADVVPAMEVFIPTPKQVVKAQSTILDAVDKGLASGKTFDEVLARPDVFDALYTYHAGSEMPVRATLFDANDLDEMVDQIGDTLNRKVGKLDRTIDLVEKIAADQGRPIRFVYDDSSGATRWATVRDYVMLRDIRNSMSRVARTSQAPMDQVGVSIDDILHRGNQVSGPLGTNDGGRYVLDGKEYYVKRYVGDAGRDQITGEVLSNALYRELSQGGTKKNLGAPNGYASASSDGSMWHVAPWVEDLETVMASGLDPFDAQIVTLADGRKVLIESGIALPEGAVSQSLSNAMLRGAAADILLSNWDVVGTGFDNIGISTTDGLVRVDQGGTFFRRAQGAEKNVRWQDPRGDLRNMLDPDKSPFGALIQSGVADEQSLMGVLGNQISDLLDLRARYGGMDGFVRRHMPGVTPEQQQPYIDFLEKRLQGFADYFEKPFHGLGSEELRAAALVQEGVSEKVVETLIREGAETPLIHRSGSEFINPFLRFGTSEAGWVDKPFLNAMPNGLSWKGTFGNPADYGYNLVLETPMGAKNIKVYGIHPDSEVRAAELALSMTADLDPEGIIRAAEELQALDKAGYSADQGFMMMSQAGGHMMLDQVVRVADADPEFFQKFLRVAREKALQMDGGTPDLHTRSISTIEMAAEMGRVEVPVGAYNWNPNVKRAQMVQKLKDSSFEERLRFAIWVTDSKGGGRQGFKRFADEWKGLVEGEAFGMQRLGEIGPLPDAAGDITDMRSMLHVTAGSALDAQAAVAGLGDDALADLPEMFSLYLAKVDQNLNPAKWAEEVAKTNRMLTGWATGMDGVLYAETDSLMPRGQPSSFSATEEFGPEWFGGKFIHLYRRSLTADGYNAAVWFNDVDSGQALFSQEPYWGLESGTGQPFPNMLFTNPLALRSADAAMTHRNIGRLFTGRSGLRAEDLTDDAIKRLEAHALDLGLDKDALLPPADPEEMIFAEDGSVTSAGQVYNDLLDSVQDPEDSTLIRALRQAITGETRFIEPEAFMQAWDNQSLGAMAPGDVGASVSEVNKDLLETLAARRAELMKDLASTRGRYGASTREFNRAVRASEAAKSAKSLAQDELNLHEWIAQTAVDDRGMKMDAAIDVLTRLGAGTDVPLESLPDDLADLRMAVGALAETDQKMLAFAMDELESGADDWLELISPLPEGARSIHKVPKREAMLDAVFRSGFKPIGSELQSPATIVEAMTAAERYVARGGAEGFLRKYDKVHNLLRAYMIAKPGFHGRNFFSATFMNHLAGINYGSYRRFMRAYWKFQEEEAGRLGLTKHVEQMRKAMRGRGINPDKVNPAHVEYVRQMAESGSLGSAGGQVATEFVESGPRGKLSRTIPTVNIRGKKVNLVDAVNPFNTRNAGLRLSKQFGMATETFVRGSLGFDTLFKGGTVDDAFDNIMKFHFDYDDLSDFERNVVKRVVPFYTWTRKNLPLMMEMMARKPKVFNQYMSLKKEIELQSDDDGAIVPRWMMRQGAIRLPFKFAGENMFITPDMPFKTPMEMLDPALAFDKRLSVGDRASLAIGSLGSMVTPLIKAPYEWQTRRNLWKGYNFDGRYEVVPRAYTMIPGMMPLLKLGGLARKNDRGDWAMKDYELHSMASLMPVFSDFRRLFPDEPRYQERVLSSWISWAFGTGLRTNTKYEQQMELISRQYEMRDERNQERSLRGSTLR